MQVLCFFKTAPGAGAFASVVQQAHRLRGEHPFWVDLPGLDDLLEENRRKDPLGRILLLYGAADFLHKVRLSQEWDDFSVLGPIDARDLWSMAEPDALCALRRHRRDFPSPRRAEKKARRLMAHLTAKGVRLERPILPEMPEMDDRARRAPHLWVTSRSTGQRFCFSVERVQGEGEPFAAMPDAYGCCREGVALPVVDEKRLFENILGTEDVSYA